MDQAQVVIALLAGSLVSAASSPEFFFIDEPMTWDDAFNYCFQHHRDLAQIINKESTDALMKTPKKLDSGKAWIGLFENSSDWNWVDQTELNYSQWSFDHVIRDLELCASMTSDGSWISDVCEEMKPSVCYYGEFNITATKIVEEMNWADAAMACEKRNSFLAVIGNDMMNAEVQALVSSKETWIGLSRPPPWYWSETEENVGIYQPWNTGETGTRSSSLEPGCAAASLKTGSWSRESCFQKYPFYCYDEKSLEMKKIVVKVTIRSGANMADPVLHDNFKQLLNSLLTKHNLAGITMTWSKLPEKTTVKGTMKPYCPFSVESSPAGDSSTGAHKDLQPSF